MYLKTDDKYSSYEHMASPKQHDFFINNCYNKGITELTLRQFNEKMKAESSYQYYNTYLKFDPRSAQSIKYPSLQLNEIAFYRMIEFSKYPYDDKELSEGLIELFDKIYKNELSAISTLKKTRQMDNMINIVKNISMFICKEIERYK